MNEKKDSFVIRTMERSEVDFAVALAANEGWNPGLYDADCFFKTDPNGFFLGLLDGEPIGCISGISYKGGFGFIGFYIVIPERRGQGYGIKLWNAALAYLKGRNVGLDGVVEQQANYKKSGFALAYRNIRFEGVAAPASGGSGNISVINDAMLGAVCDYDRRFFPVKRQGFLRCWTHMPESKAVAFIANGVVCGYGVIRRCRKGYKIGPLFADTGDIAETLFTNLTNNAEPGAPIYLDVPEANPAAVDLAGRHHMEKVFETARMYTGRTPEIDTGGIFGVTTFELG
jgi:GNAT superfamily N-acetyltransferase